MKEKDILILLDGFTKRRYEIYLYIIKNNCNISDISRHFKISYKEAHREIEILLVKGYITKSKLKLKHQPCLLKIKKKVGVKP